ncbi:O-antigen ligase family protein [Streptomyces sp. NPDC005963]|uniref:O-antigen ligase family protein n=1 Tax=Streptomyces sp. NPDC005963 TaxID=3156721 RepID=UPI0033F1E58A
MDRGVGGVAGPGVWSRQERGRAADAVGAVVLGGCATWSLISAAGRDARPEGVLLAVFAVAAGYACGRISGTLLPVAAASAISVGALGLAIVSPVGVPGVYTSAPVQPGHLGATAGLLVLAAGAACSAAAAAGPRAARRGLRLLALAVVVTAVTLESVTGAVAAAGVLLCALATARMQRRALALVGLALAAALVTAVSWGVAKNALPDGLTGSLKGGLTHHRVALWHDAVELAEDDPIRGAGPGRFGVLSPTALDSVGSDGKPHSAPLQQAAEQGVPGVVLLATAFGWLLYGLWRSPRPTPVVLSAAAALTALAVVASASNALSFAPVTAGAGLLAGLATARVAGSHPPEGNRSSPAALGLASRS